MQNKKISKIKNKFEYFTQKMKALTKIERQTLKKK